MRKFLILFLFLFQFALGANFGEYNYSKYAAINSQLQFQRARAIRNQQMRAIPARNIQYPSANNPYPNISRSQNPQLSARTRYSPNYYRNYY